MKSHEWAFAENGVATVGVSDHAQHEVTDVVFVELPKVGRKVVKEQACCVIESVKAAFDIYAPASGEIVAVNEAVVKDPALVNRSPHEEGWLFRIKLQNPSELDALMDWTAYQNFLKTAPAGGH
jgi:glycine cleavage system H protein